MKNININNDVTMDDKNLKGLRYMATNLPDIIYNTVYKNPEVDSDNSYYKLEFNKTDSFLDNYDSYTRFIKNVERFVRTDKRYKAYIRYLKEQVKLNSCQVLKNVDDEDAPIEMHHGPIFTLYDICSIMVEYFRLKKWNINTFTVSDAVLSEHQENRIGVVMVSETVHEQIHNGEIFINIHQAWGNINAFIKKYNAVIKGSEFETQLNTYIDRSLLYDSTDFSILDLQNHFVKLDVIK